MKNTEGKEKQSNMDLLEYPNMLAEEEESFAALYEQSVRKPCQEGSVVIGTVLRIDKDCVVVDVGDKSEGEIPISEFLSETNEIDVNVGDELDIYVEKREVDGSLRLSREKAASIKVWDEIAKIQSEDGIIDGKINHRVRGGLSVDIGVPAFLPFSQIDLRPVKDLDGLIGQSFPFKILKYNRRRNNVVVSRRAILEAERDAMRDKLRTSLSEGMVLEGSITNITDYGLFVDLGGLDGLCHITDLSWGRVSHPSKIYNVGDKIAVKVIKYDQELEKVSLGIKQLKQDPWSTVAERYPIGTKVKGTVVSIADYGAFLELEEGVEGLIHVSEMSWTKKIRHPSKIVSVGDEVEVIVLNVDTNAKRISLGMKQLHPNPWDLVAENYPVGSIIEGEIKNITDFGIFIGIEEGIDGLIHVSDLSWTHRVKHPGEIYQKGQKIQAMVLKIDRDNERFSLGIKQLEPDPWEEVAKRFCPGTKVEGRTTNVTDFGIFVELEEGIEGMVHVSEISKEKVKTPVGLYNVGDNLTAKVINVSAKDRKIGLSIKALDDDTSHQVYEQYMKKSSNSPSTIGDLLKEEFEHRAEESQE